MMSVIEPSPSTPPTGEADRLRHEFAIERADGQQQIEKLETAIRRIAGLCSTRQPGGMRAIRQVVNDALSGTAEPHGGER